MLFSSRHLLEIRGRLVAITLEQWLLLAMGMIAGCVVWVLFNRRIFHRITGRLKKTFKANAIAAVAGIIGGTVFLVNAGLVYLATWIASFSCFHLPRLACW